MFNPFGEMPALYTFAPSDLNNLGPALGDATENYASLNDASKIILSFTMILGRLEIYTLLVLFTTFFWRS